MCVTGFIIVLYASYTYKESYWIYMLALLYTYIIAHILLTLLSLSVDKMSFLFLCVLIHLLKGNLQSQICSIEIPLFEVDINIAHVSLAAVHM